MRIHRITCIICPCFSVLYAKYTAWNGDHIMRVISAPPPATNADILEAFRHQLVARDLAPATSRAYLHDLARFHTWLAWVHEGTAPLLTQIRPIDLAAFRTYLIYEQAHAPATVNRRLQGLRLLFQWLYACHWITENPAAHLRFMRKAGTQQPRALRRREVFALVHAAARRAVQAYLDTLSDVSAPTPVFLSKRGTWLAVRSAQAVVAQLAVHAGIQRLPVSAHTLRHTFAVYYLQRHPGKLRDLADLLGHESLDTTALYTKPSRDDVAADLERSPLNVCDF